MIIARASANTTTQCRARVGFNAALAAFCSDVKRADDFDDIGSSQSLSAPGGRVAPFYTNSNRQMDASPSFHNHKRGLHSPFKSVY